MGKFVNGVYKLSAKEVKEQHGPWDGKWIVHTKGGPNKQSFEICVIREDYKHGIKSYGWFNKAKMLISHSGGPCHDSVSTMVWNSLARVAKEVAETLNMRDKVNKYAQFLNV
jgi:hypothetical protein